MAKTKEELREVRMQMFAPMEQKMKGMHTKEDDSLFYYHSSEDRIVLSHAMFWTMTQPQFFKGKIRKEKFFLLCDGMKKRCWMPSSRMMIISRNYCITAISCMSCYLRF